MMLSDLVGAYWCLGEHIASFFTICYPADDGSAFFQMVGMHGVTQETAT
jgi:hypothetical protein